VSRLFLDANVPTYAAGRDHPLKEPCKEIVGLAARYPHAFFTNAEVLQEMMHRYLSSGRFATGKQAIVDFSVVMRGAVEAVTATDVERALELAGEYATQPGSGLAARDVLHAAVMLRIGARKIVSADRDFDELEAEGIERLDPAAVEQWSAGLGAAD
jgi:predicted nucleic acid-binding protein